MIILKRQFILTLLIILISKNIFAQQDSDEKLHLLQNGQFQFIKKI